nr:hypothetical protein Itr_chr09CG03700 [Ipomoea trifida]
MAYDDYDYDYSGYESYDDDEPHFDYPKLPPPSEDGGDCSYASAEDIPPPPSSPVDCPGVVERLSACQEYLNGHNDLPSPPCCDNLEAKNMWFLTSIEFKIGPGHE